LHENVIELAEEVAETLPGDLEVCLFVCTGTEACELARGWRLLSATVFLIPRVL